MSGLSAPSLSHSPVEPTKTRATSDCAARRAARSMASWWKDGHRTKTHTGEEAGTLSAVLNGQSDGGAGGQCELGCLFAAAGAHECIALVL